ncbi:MAG: rod shape-determining protein RodA, partial [Paludibacteraceae bacterium]|nr:rod shape-determining protein RodA [Paludibacteraceae bacterium]
GYIFYAVMIVLLIITPLFARDIKGSLSWLTLGPISLQPAEFAKCFTAIAVAKYMSRYGYKVRDLRDLIVPFLLMGVPMLIIMVAQRETGSALVFISFLLAFYRQGMSGYVLSWGVASILLFILVIRFGETTLPFGMGNVGILVSTLIIHVIVLGLLIAKEKDLRTAIIVALGVAFCYGIGLLINIWTTVDFNIIAIASLAYVAIFLLLQAVKKRKSSMGWIVGFVMISTLLCQGCDYAFHKILQPHQRIRIEVLLGMKDDPHGAGYNVNQSLIAIGSGQVTGKGFLQGTQTKLKFVPEQDTDFIFCTVGEEWGFVGSAGLLLLYLALILRIIYIAERQRDKFSMIYAYCVAGILLFHVTINIGMVLGLLPVIGIPLPFFSYGGSSLWGFTILLAIMLRMDAARVNKMQG